MCSGLCFLSHSALWMSKELVWVFIFLPFLPRGTGADKPSGGKKRREIILYQKGPVLALDQLPQPWIEWKTLTEVILQLLGAPFFCWCYQVPHEALYFVIATIMDQAVSEKGSTDGLHVPLSQLFLKTTVNEDIFPSTPTGKRKSQNLFF